MIGFQSHFGATGLPGFDTIGQRLDRFAALGTRMEVTEFNVRTSDEQFQADYTRDFLRSIFSYPAMSAFVIWDPWEGENWVPAEAMIRSDWSLKPSGQVWLDTTQQPIAASPNGRAWPLPHTPARALRRSRSCPRARAA